MTPQYTFSPEVLAFSQKEGIPEEALPNMVDRAARYTWNGMNRRFHSWLFYIEGTAVLKMTKDPYAGED